MKKKIKTNARREAYAVKQEKEGRKVVEWILGILVTLGVAYAVWASFMMG